MTKLAFNFRERVPDILLESFFIVCALLLALALDQWRDEQKELELASKAKLAIYTELADNKKKLEEKRTEHQKILETIQAFIKSESLKKQPEGGLQFEYSMVLISNSAWNSAKMTQVVQSFDFGEITNFSQIYQMQDLYLSNQNKIIEKVMGMGELTEHELLGFSKGLEHRLRILIDINKNFCDGLASVLAEQTITTKEI
jgi:hypothetical protein